MLLLEKLRFMVFKATFNQIWAISCRSVLLMEETGVPGENHRPAVSHWQTFSHNVVWITPHTDCRGSYKCNYDHDHDGPSIRTDCGPTSVNHSQIWSCGHLYQAVTCIKRSPFSCPLIENFLWIEHLLRGHLS